MFKGFLEEHKGFLEGIIFWGVIVGVYFMATAFAPKSWAEDEPCVTGDYDMYEDPRGTLFD